MFDLTIEDFNGEPRMRDIDIAEALEFDRPRKIRELITRHLTTLEMFGRVIVATVARNQRPTVGRGAELSAPYGGPPVDEFWLNEKQTVFIGLKSEAPKAVELTVQAVKVFVDWKHGRLAPPVEPRKFGNYLHPEADTWRGIVREARILFGKEAAAAMWHQSGLPEIGMPADLKEIPEPTDLQTFLSKCCIVTGSARDFTTSRELIDAFRDWAQELGAPPSADRTVSLALRRLAGRYRDPETGYTFGPGKQRVTGYRGICLKAVHV